MAELLNLLFNLANSVKATNPVHDPSRPAQVVKTSPMGDAPDMSNWAYIDGGAASDPRAGPMGTRINRPFPGYEIEWPSPRADANRLEGVGTGLPAGYNPDLLTAAVRKLFGTIPGIGPIGRGFVSDESPVTAPGLPRTPPTTDVATRPPPMSILDSIGAVASNSPAGTATGSLPDGLKSLFAPLMESMVRDATLRNDPISRMGDVGLAMLDASGGGKPFAQSLAPLDAARQQATGGAMNMFLQVMGLDKQLEEMKAQERRFTASYELDKARLDLTKAQSEKESWTIAKIGEKDGNPIYGRVSKSGKVEPLVMGIDSARDDKPYPTHKGKPVLTPGQQAVDQNFGKEYSELVASGGMADVQKNLAQLRKVQERLKAGERLTGPEIGNLPRGIMRNTNPTATQALEMVEEVVQRNLRLILGAQFTQKEGDRLVQRAYNAALPPSYNAERLARLGDAMERALEAKKQAITYFEKHGTMAGYKGQPVPSMADIENSIGTEGAPTGKLPPGVAPKRTGTLPDGRKVIEGSDGGIYDADGRKIR